MKIFFGEERGAESRNRIVQNNEEKCDQQINEVRIEKTGKEMYGIFRWEQTKLC